MSVTIQIATADDAEAVQAFLAGAVPTQWRRFSSADSAQCRRALSCAQARAVLSWKDGHVIGLAFGWVLPSLIEAGDAVMLDELIVAPEHRGSGIGTALVEAFVELARATASPPVHIWATTDMPEEPAAGPFRRTGGVRGDLFRQYDWLQREQSA